MNCAANTAMVDPAYPNHIGARGAHGDPVATPDFFRFLWFAAREQVGLPHAFGKNPGRLARIQRWYVVCTHPNTPKQHNLELPRKRRPAIGIGSDELIAQTADSAKHGDQAENAAGNNMFRFDIGRRPRVVPSCCLTETSFGMAVMVANRRPNRKRKCTDQEQFLAQIGLNLLATPCALSPLGPVHKNCGRLCNRVDRRPPARPAYKKSQTAQGLGD